MNKILLNASLLTALSFSLSACDLFGVRTDGGAPIVGGTEQQTQPQNKNTHQAKKTTTEAETHPYDDGSTAQTQPKQIVKPQITQQVVSDQQQTTGQTPTSGVEAINPNGSTTQTQSTTGTVTPTVSNDTVPNTVFPQITPPTTSQPPITSGGKDSVTNPVEVPTQETGVTTTTTTNTNSTIPSVTGTPPNVQQPPVSPPTQVQNSNRLSFVQQEAIKPVTQSRVIASNNDASMPKMPAAAVALARQAENQRLQGNHSAAAAMLERALRIDPKQSYLWNRLARVRLEQGNFGQARSLAQKSNSLAKGNAGLSSDNKQIISQTQGKK